MRKEGKDSYARKWRWYERGKMYLSVGGRGRNEIEG